MLVHQLQSLVVYKYKILAKFNKNILEGSRSRMGCTRKSVYIIICKLRATSFISVKFIINWCAYTSCLFLEEVMVKHLPAHHWGRGKKRKPWRSSRQSKRGRDVQEAAIKEKSGSEKFQEGLLNKSHDQGRPRKIMIENVKIRFKKLKLMK